MRPPGRTLHVSGGDYMLAGLWLKPAQIDALSNHHTRALAAATARDDDAVGHHTAWLRDLNRAVADRANHRRASGALADLAGLWASGLGRGAA